MNVHTGIGEHTHQHTVKAALEPEHLRALLVPRADYKLRSTSAARPLYIHLSSALAGTAKRVCEPHEAVRGEQEPMGLSLWAKLGGLQQRSLCLGAMNGRGSVGVAPWSARKARIWTCACREALRERVTKERRVRGRILLATRTCMTVSCVCSESSRSVRMVINVDEVLEEAGSAGRL